MIQELEDLDELTWQSDVGLAKFVLAFDQLDIKTGKFKRVSKLLDFDGKTH